MQLRWPSLARSCATRFHSTQGPRCGVAQHDCVLLGGECKGQVASCCKGHRITGRQATKGTARVKERPRRPPHVAAHSAPGRAAGAAVPSGITPTPRMCVPIFGSRRNWFSASSLW